VPGPILPFWLVAPPCVLAMFFLAAHARGVTESQMPASRRRIRQANALLMLFTLPLLAYALSLASPGSPRVFVMSWVTAMALLVMILGLALLDIANSWRLHRSEVRALRREVFGASTGRHGTR
jgi:ABC-type dipeptide/oligopeptide/nickel transport system permease subunit